MRSRQGPKCALGVDCFTEESLILLLSDNAETYGLVCYPGVTKADANPPIKTTQKWNL